MRIFIDISSGDSEISTVPARVQNVQAIDMDGSIEISWSELTGLISDEDGEVVKYIIEKRVNNGTWQLEREITEIDWVAGFFIMDFNVEAGNTYYYRIKAETSLSKQTAWSQEASITLEEDEPSEIFNPPTVSLELKPDGIQVTWTVDTNNTIPTTHNEFETIKDSEPPVYSTVSAGSNTARYSTVVEGSTYKFRVRAYNSEHGYSEWSEQETIVFDPVSPAHKELVTFSSSTFPNETCKYYKYLPEGYDEAANESLYCFIMLHGLGEFRDRISGTEADKDAGIWQNGPARHIYLDDDLEEIGIAPHVFICPQQPFGTNFNNTIPSDRWNFNYLNEIYNIAIGLEKVDPNKIIITGLSMGGMAAQRYASLNPEKIYKCLVIAPNWLNADNEVFAHQVPLWVIHGQNDTTGGGFGVGTTRTKIMDINALDPTYPPKFTCPTGVGHNSWDKTYNGVGWTVEELTPDPNGGAGVDPIGNPDHNPYVWATTGDKTNIIA